MCCYNHLTIASIKLWIATPGKSKSQNLKPDTAVFPSSACFLLCFHTRGPCELLFKNRLGHMIDSKGIARQWKSFLEAMAQTEEQLIQRKMLKPLSEALPPLVPYDLRHTFCTDLERAGVPLNVASQLMGHSSIEITARIYTHTTQDVFHETAVKLDAFAIQKGDIANASNNHLNPPNIQKSERTG